MLKFKKKIRRQKVNREALWFKMTKIGVRESICNCIKIIYQDIKFCVKCGENLIPSCATQKSGVCKGCGLSTYLFNIFINYIIENVDTEERHSPVINNLQIPLLLFANDFAIASFTDCELQKKTEVADEYCKKSGI